MHIAYTGPISLNILSEELKLSVRLEDKTFRFDLGSYLILEFLRAGHIVSVCKLTNVVDCPRIVRAGNLTLRLFPDRPISEQYRGFYRKEVKILSKAIKEIKPDVVFANWPYQFARAAIKSGFPTLVVAHDSPWRVLWQMRDKARLLRTFYSQFFVFPYIKYLTAVSPHIANDMRKFNKYKRNVRVIPNALIPCGMPALDNLRAVIRKDGRTFVSITEWSRLKNPTAILRAFSIVNKRHPQWRLIVYGRGFGRTEAAERFCRDQEIPINMIEFRGYQVSAEIRKCLCQEADVMVGLSREESFGFTFLEAMASGVPCIGGRESGAVPWVIGGGGVLTDVEDVNLIAREMERLMLDYDLRVKLANVAYERAHSQFELKLVVREYLDALYCVAKGGEGW